MKIATIVLVSAGLILAVVLGFARGFDTTSLTVLAFIVVVGALAIAAAARSAGGAVSPARCRECNGVISPHAPFCKHCGARRAAVP